MTNKKWVTAFAVGAVALAGVSSASAFGGRGQGQNFDSELRDTLEQALENDDYTSWVQAHTDAGITDIADKVTEEQFEKMVQMHEARENGDTATAQALAEELGFGMGQGQEAGKGAHDGAMRGGSEGGLSINRYDTYAEWKTAMAENSEMTEVLANVTEADFNQMKTLHTQMQELQKKFQPNRMRATDK